MFLYKCDEPSHHHNEIIQLLALFMFSKYVECDNLAMYFC